MNKNQILTTKISEAEVHPQQEKLEDQSKKFLGGAYHPWRRFWARSVDLIFLGLGLLFVFSIVFGALFPQDAEKYVKVLKNPIFAGIIIYILWIPVEAAFLSLTGTTPTKWLFGIRVLKKTGAKLSYSEALRRTLLVFIQGEGFGIPIATLFTRLFSYRRLTTTGTTRWDTSIGSSVTHTEWGVIRGFACFICVVAALLFVIVLRSI